MHLLPWIASLSKRLQLSAVYRRPLMNVSALLVIERILLGLNNKSVIMSTHEELEQELLAFKHLEQYPAALEELPYKVSEITHSCIHLRQLYDNAVDRRRLINKYSADLQLLGSKLASKPKLLVERKDDETPQDSQWQENEIQLFAKELELSHIKIDDKQCYRVLSQTNKLEKEVFEEIRQSFASFGFVKEKAESAGEFFKYSAISEEEMWSMAQSQFNTALEAIGYIRDGMNSDDWEGCLTL